MPRHVDLTCGETLLLLDVLEQYIEGLEVTQKDMEADGTLSLDDLLLYSALNSKRAKMAGNLRTKLGTHEHSSV